jgi:hypothetical protein
VPQKSFGGLPRNVRPWRTWLVTGKADPRGRTSPRDGVGMLSQSNPDWRRHALTETQYHIGDRPSTQLPPTPRAVSLNDRGHWRGCSSTSPFGTYRIVTGPNSIFDCGRLNLTTAISSPRGGESRFGGEDWRVGLGRCLCSLLSRPFVCECHSISTMPRFQSPPRRTQRADFPHYALLFASPQGLWDLSCRGDFRP